ncbi:MAG: PKD domain-containing protein [Deinococcales bacterium]
MKNFIYAIFGVFALLVACNQPPKPPSSKALVRFLVQSTLGQALAGVQLSVVNTSQSSNTDNDGKASLQLESEKSFTVKLSKNGFTEQFKVVNIPKGSKELSLQAALLERQPARTIPRVEQGGQASAKHGVRLELPAAALVNAQGQAVSGALEVSMTPVNTASDELNAFPGRFEGIAESGSSTPLVSYGVVEFVLSQNGQEVNLAPGKSAQIQMPFYASQHPNGTAVKIGDSVPLWSLNETTGIWTQEGTGTVIASNQSPTGFALEATVSHFSWWNIDVAPQTAHVRVKCLGNNAAFIPLGQSCDLEGESLDPDTPRGIAETRVPIGEFSPELIVPAASAVQLTVCTPVAKKPDLEIVDACGSKVISSSANSVTEHEIQLELLEDIRLRLDTPAADLTTDGTLNLSGTLESGKPIVVELIAYDLFTQRITVLKSFTAAPFVFTWDTTTVKQSIYFVAFQAVTSARRKVLSNIRTVTVDRNNPPPIASFSHQFQPSLAPFSYTFDASASQGQGVALEQLEWDFGDGASLVTKSNSPFTHRFLTPGEYTVRLTVEDLDGERSQTSQRITVRALESAGEILFERVGLPLELRNQTEFAAKILNTPFTLSWEARYAPNHPIPELRGQCVDPILLSQAPLVRPQSEDCTVTTSPGETYRFRYTPDSPLNTSRLRPQAAVNAYQEPILITASTPQGFVSQLSVTLEIPAVPALTPNIEASCSESAGGITQNVQVFRQFNAPSDWYALQARASRAVRVAVVPLQELAPRTDFLTIQANSTGLTDPLKGSGGLSALVIICDTFDPNTTLTLSNVETVARAGSFAIGTQTMLPVSARGDFFLIEPSSFGLPPAFLDGRDSLLGVGGDGMLASLFGLEGKLSSGGCQSCASFVVGKRLALPLDNPQFVLMLRPKAGAGAATVPVIAAVPAAFSDLALNQTLSARLPSGEIPVLLNLNAPQGEWALVTNNVGVFVGPVNGLLWSVAFPSYSDLTARSWLAARSNGQAQQIEVKPHTAFNEQNAIPLGKNLQIRLSGAVSHVSAGTPVSGSLTAPVSNPFLGSNTGTLDYAQLYSFDATQGNKLTISVTTPTFVKYVVISPTGQVVKECFDTQTTGSAQCTNVAIALPSTGKYALVLQNGSRVAATSYGFTLNIAP